VDLYTLKYPVAKCQSAEYWSAQFDLDWSWVCLVNSHFWPTICQYNLAATTYQMIVSYVWQELHKKPKIWGGKPKWNICTRLFMLKCSRNFDPHHSFFWMQYLVAFSHKLSNKKYLICSHFVTYWFQVSFALYFVGLQSRHKSSSLKPHVSGNFMQDWYKQNSTSWLICEKMFVLFSHFKFLWI
jgi:hypothetical protein